jgi:hypothetical protein
VGLVRHFKDPRFTPLYNALPASVRDLADKYSAPLKQDPKHSSLHFKRLKGNLWSVGIRLAHRALAVEKKDGFQWYWIGSHAEYNRLVG